VADYGKQIGRLNIRVLPNASRFRQDIAKVIRRIEATMQVNLEVRANTIRAHFDVGELVEEYDGRDINMTVSAGTAAARAQIATLTRPRSLSLIVRVREASIAKAEALLKGLTGIRVAQDLLEKVNLQLGNLDRNVGRISRVGAAFANLASLVSSSAAGLVTVTGDLVKIGNLGLVLPAAFAGAITGITTLVIALRTAKTELAPLAPAMNELAGIMQSGFWGAAREPILNLVTGLLPSLRTGFGNTATAIGNQVGTLSNELARTLGGGVLDGMFQKLVETIDIVTTGMKPLAEAFTTLGVVGSTYLPRLATYLVEIGNKFNDWVQVSAANGDLYKFIEQGIQAAKDFGSAISGIVGILRGIDRAATAAGGGGLGAFAAAMQGAATILQSPAVQTALTTILIGARQALDGLGVGMNAVGKMLMENAPTIQGVLTLAGEAVGGLVKAIADAMTNPAFQDGLLKLFQGIKLGADALGPAMGPLADLFGTLGVFVGALAQQFGELLAQVKITFAPILETILTTLQPLIPFFGELLVGAIAALTPLFTELGNFVNDNQEAFTVLAGVLVTVLPAVAGIGAAITGLNGIMGSAVLANLRLGASFIANLPKMIASGAQTAILAGMYAKDFVVAVGKAVAALALKGAAMVKSGAQSAALAAMYGKDMVAALAAQTAALVKSGAAWVANAAKTVASKAVLLAVSVATKAAAAAQWLLNAAMTANPIGLIIAAIVAVVAALVWFFTQTDAGKAIWSGFMSFLSEAWTNIVNVATTVWNTLVSVISDVWNNIVSFITTVIQVIVLVVQTYITMVVTIWTTIWNAIVAVVTTVWNAIVTAVTVAIQFVIAVVTTYVNILVAIWTAIWTAIVTVVTTVWNAIVAAVTAAIQFVILVVQTYIAILVAVWTAIWTTIVTVVTTVWNTIVAAVTAAIQFVILVVQTYIGILVTIWTTIWTTIVTVVTTVWNAIVAYVTTAIALVQSVITSIVSAIVSWWTSTWDSIVQTITTVWGLVTAYVSTAIGVVQSTIASVMSAIQGVWDGIWNAISSTVTTVVNAVKGFVSGMVTAISDKITAVVSTVTGVKDQIVGFFAGAGEWLLDAGTAIVQGLIDGITGMVDAAKGAIEDIMGGIAAFLPHSPAKEGPFSGKGWTPYSGRALVDGFADGMDDRLARVRAAAAAMAEAATTDAKFDMKSAETSLDAARAEELAVASDGGTRVLVKGNVGYDPKKIADEIDLKKRQAQMRAQTPRVAIA
jgi:phage-related protein